MATSVIEHSIPTDLTLAWGLNISRWQESFTTEGESGYAVSRTFWDRHRRIYKGRFTDWGVGNSTSNTKLRKYQRFLEQLHGKDRCFYLVEQATEQHDNVLIGVGNGTTTVFPYPKYGGTLSDRDMVFTNGQMNSGLTPTAANALSEECAACSSADAAYVTPIGSATFSVGEWDARDGLYCLFGLPGSGTYGHGIPSTERPVAAKLETWTAMASIKGNGTFKVTLVYYSSGGSELYTHDSASTGCDWTRWYDINVTAAAANDGAIAYVGMKVLKTVGSAENWLVSCQGLAEGNVARWWLPSSGMYSLVFAAAPSLGTIVTTSFLGRRITRVRMTSAKIGSNREALGDTEGAEFDAIEEWEV